jgi:hypothetical protein
MSAETVSEGPSGRFEGVFYGLPGAIYIKMMAIIAL